MRNLLANNIVNNQPTRKYHQVRPSGDSGRLVQGEEHVWSTFIHFRRESKSWIAHIYPHGDTCKLKLRV